MNVAAVSGYKKMQSTAVNAAVQSAVSPIIEASSEEKPAIVVTISEKARRAIEASYQSDVNKYNLIKEKENSDAQIKAYEEMAKCLEIARRISSGAKVPSQDHERLMKYSFKLYLAALQAATMGKSSEEYDSLFEDEEKGDSGETMSPEDIGADSREMLARAEKAAAAEVTAEQCTETVST